MDDTSNKPPLRLLSKQEVAPGFTALIRYLGTDV